MKNNIVLSTSLQYNSTTPGWAITTEIQSQQRNTNFPIIIRKLVEAELIVNNRKQHFISKIRKTRSKGKFKIPLSEINPNEILLTDKRIKKLKVKLDKLY